MKKILLATVALAIFANCTGNVNASESKKSDSKFTDQRMQEISEGLKYITDTAIEYIHKYNASQNELKKLNKEHQASLKKIEMLNGALEQQAKTIGSLDKHINEQNAEIMKPAKKNQKDSSHPLNQSVFRNFHISM